MQTVRFCPGSLQPCHNHLRKDSRLSPHGDVWVLKWESLNKVQGPGPTLTLSSVGPSLNKVQGPGPTLTLSSVGPSLNKVQGLGPTLTLSSVGPSLNKVQGPGPTLTLSSVGPSWNKVQGLTLSPTARGEPEQSSGAGTNTNTLPYSHWRA